MKENISNLVFDYLQNPIKDLGYELYEVDYSKKTNGMNLTLFITHGEAPVSLQDCELVHKTVDPMLDTLNPTKDAPYYLNVSSVGLDKPIKTDKDFARTIGKLVEIKLFSPTKSAKEFLGTLKSFDENCVALQIDNEELFLERKNIALCKIYIDF